jgi:hypothetical protein
MSQIEVLIGKIVSKEEKKNSKGNTFYKYKVKVGEKELTMNDLDNYIEKKQPLNLELDATYELRYEISEYEYNGELVSSKNIISAIIVDKEEKSEFQQAKDYKQDTPDKDRRISRLAVLNTATEITNLKYKNKLCEKDITPEIIELAELLEGWVYR